MPLPSPGHGLSPLRSSEPSGLLFRQKFPQYPYEAHTFRHDHWNTWSKWSVAALQSLPYKNWRTDQNNHPQSYCQIHTFHGTIPCGHGQNYACYPSALPHRGASGPNKSLSEICNPGTDSRNGSSFPHSARRSFQVPF